MRRAPQPATERQLVIIGAASLLVGSTLIGVLALLRFGVLVGVAAFVLMALAEAGGWWFMLRRRREMIERGELQARR